MLSVALICAVAGMVTSLKATLVNRAIIAGGNRHLTIENVSKKDLRYFTNNSHVKNMYLSETLGYAKVDNTNKYKPYAYVVGYTKSAFDNTTLKIVSGRLPIDSREIVVSVPFQNNAKVKIGDTISLDIGKRVCTDGTVLNQSNPYYVEEGEINECQEYITDTHKHEYKIVGIMERLNYSIEGYSAPGYVMITKIDDVSDNINVSLLFKDAGYYKEYINNISNDNDLNKYNMIKTENLSMVFTTEEVQTKALNEVTLHVEQGEFVAIMGPSGCGKSTLLNILGTLDSPTSGSYFFEGKQVDKMNENQLTALRKNNLGFIFQSFNLIDELNVFENVELPLTYLKVKASERKQMVNDILKRMNISHRANHFPQQLSGGQQQRVAIARAVVSNPKIILADEPTGNLDSKNGAEVMQLLTELNKEGTTIVMVTHSKHDASFAHRVINLFDGSIVSSVNEFI